MVAVLKIQLLPLMMTVILNYKQ